MFSTASSLEVGSFTLTAWPGQHHTTASPVSVCLRCGCDTPFPYRHNKHTRITKNCLEVPMMYFVTVTEESVGSYLSEWFLARLGCRSCSTSKMFGCRKNATILSLYAGTQMEKNSYQLNCIYWIFMLHWVFLVMIMEIVILMSILFDLLRTLKNKPKD